jgi:hypothetical protein
VSGRTAARAAWSLTVVSVVLIPIGLLLAVAADGVTPTFDLASAIVLVILPAIGGLVASRLPHNPIGWLFLGSGFLLALSGATFGWAGFVLTEHPERLLGGTAAAWLTSWVFLPAIFGVPPLLFLLFPDGRPLSRRWRLAVALTVVSLVAMSMGAALEPGPLDDSPVAGVRNPVGVAGPLPAVAEQIGWTTALVSILLATVSLVLRFRRSHGEERVQLRWVTTSAALFLLGCLVSAGLFVTRFAALGQLLVVITFCTIPVAAAIAILRYRLYDIDLVINRALVYGSLSAALAVVYLGSVLLLQLVLNPLAPDSDLAVAGSTLAVAAAFGPIRSRVQAAVDRHFYRRRYDAARTLEGFVGRLRHELDLEAVVGDFRSVVRETVQPSHVGLWLRRR